MPRIAVHLWRRKKNPSFFAGVTAEKRGGVCVGTRPALEETFFFFNIGERVEWVETAVV